MTGACQYLALPVLLLLQMMNNMGGEDDLPDLDGADDVRIFIFCFTIFACVHFSQIQ